MADETYRRKLTAILSADVVGYSLLMADNEIATVATLKSYKETMASLIQDNNGRVVDAPGDNLLAEFASALDAVNSAVKIQQAISAKNAELPDNQQMQFRIGINIGDVIHEGDCIYGDGVNVAARIESLADPGGVCISRSVFDHVKKMQELGFEYLGEQAVKNISEPVRVYRILADPAVAGKILGEKRFIGLVSRKMAMTLILALTIVAGGLGSYYIYLYQSGRLLPFSNDTRLPQMPKEPSIAVLPFENISDDPKNEYLIDGISDSIITGLSKVPDLFVISRNSSFTYKGKAVDVTRVGKELGVQHVLEGSVVVADDRIRISAQLTDTITRGHIWSERYERKMNDIFQLQDDITKRILEALQIKLTVGQEARVYAEGTNNLDAYLKFLEARDLILRINREDNRIGKQLISEVIKLDPDFAAAYFVLSTGHFIDIMVGSTASAKDSLMESIEYSKKAVAMDETLSSAQAFLGFLYANVGRYDEGVALCRRGVELGPTDEAAHRYLALALRYSGNWDDALIASQRAVRLNPFPDSGTLHGLGLAYAFTGKYEKAINACQEATLKNPDNLVSQVTLALVYGMAGRIEEAKQKAANVLRLDPNFTAESYVKRLKYRRAEDSEKILNSLKKAGL